MRQELPKMPKGEGTFSYHGDGIMYRKTVKGKRLTVHGKTVSECLKKMKEKEKHDVPDLSNQSLLEAMLDWHRTYRYGTGTIKPSTADREYHTIRNQIGQYPIAKMPQKSINSRDIQKHLNTLIEKDYSYSVVKKTYEVLNQYFTHAYSSAPLGNPMRNVHKPQKEAMNVTEKEIEIYDEEDIQALIAEATRQYSNGRYVYQYGWGIVILLYTFLRINEALALHWRNVHDDYIEVVETLSRVLVDHDGDKNKYQTITQVPKKNSVRKVYLCDEAKEAFAKFREIQVCTEPNDYVFGSKSGFPNNPRNLRRTLNNIENKANTKLQNSGLHVLRHTGISIFARSGVDIGVIAKMAGHKDLTMVQRVYRHIMDDDQIEAIKLVSKKGTETL